jgi:urease accessory protein
MVAELGLTVDVASLPFEPEAGAYGHAGTNGHSHGHHHAH